MVQMVEKPFDVCVKNISRLLPLNHGVQFLDCHMAVSVWTETHHFIIEMRLEHRLYHSLQGILYQLREVISE